jgi:hypothetical protein
LGIKYAIHVPLDRNIPSSTLMSMACFSNDLRWWGVCSEKDYGVDRGAILGLKCLSAMPIQRKNRKSSLEQTRLPIVLDK